MRIVTILLTALSLLISVSGEAGATPDNGDNEMDLSGHWIDVDLDSLMATAYDGANPAYVALVTSGQSGFETPVGNFHILWREDHQTMDSATVGIPAGSPNYYLQEDVRYIQYITSDGTALHGNYWQPDSVFGEINTSHSCVSMRNDDAAYFWDFASVGTPVIIHHSEVRVAQSVIGQPLADASAALSATGFAVQVTEQTGTQSPPGTVISQSPLGGLVPSGSVVMLSVSSLPATPTPIPTPTAIPTATPKPRTARAPEKGISLVPDIVGLSEKEARQLIDQAGLQITYIHYQTESDVDAANRSFFLTFPAGSVASVTPVVGTQLPAGSIISVAVRQQ